MAGIPRISIGLLLIWLPLTAGQAQQAHAQPKNRIQDGNAVSGNSAAPPTGSIAGQLRDATGRKTYAGRVPVFICDQVTGLPLNNEAREPLQFPGQLERIWFTTTDERGNFEFTDVPTGTYRLVAQSWTGTVGFPGFSAKLKPSSFLVLHGVANDVVVQAGKQTIAIPRQLGNHTLTITNNPREAHALLLISLQPIAGDAILGPFAWNKQFLQNMIGATQMEVPHVTIVGLPKHAVIHAALANYDNSPGFGAASFAPGQTEGTMRIVAAWSNGHKDAPPRLQELVDHLRAHPISVKQLIDQTVPVKQRIDQAARMELFRRIAVDENYSIDIPQLGKRRLVDVLAALSYIKLQKKQRRP